MVVLQNRNYLDLTKLGFLKMGGRAFGKHKKKNRQPLGGNFVWADLGRFHLGVISGGHGWVRNEKLIPLEFVVARTVIKTIKI